MEFSYFKQLIPKLKEIILPGLKAQLPMASVKRNQVIKHKIKLTFKTNKASVLICVYKNNLGKACFALIERSEDNSVHSGQVCLPGGKIEKSDGSNWFTAIRETNEEIGLNVNKSNFVKELSSIYIPPSNFLVYPYLASYDITPSFKINNREVKKVFGVSLSSLLDEKSVVSVDITNHYMNEKVVPAYKFDQQIVWGATAMILSEFKFLLKQLLNNRG